jgi:hypothetical protein
VFSADVGTVIHPAALGGQILGRSILGIGHAIGQKWVFDQKYGVAVARRFYSNKPPTILDVPRNMQWDAVGLPDPETPVGARGIGEPPVASGCSAVLNAISAAVGDEAFQRAPVNADGILASLEAGRPMMRPLTANVSDTGVMRILWEAKSAGPAPPAAAFRITIHSAISGRPLLVAVDQKGAGKGTAFVGEDPRVFFAEVDSLGLDWSFTVEERLN